MDLGQMSKPRLVWLNYQGLSQCTNDTTSKMQWKITNQTQTFNKCQPREAEEVKIV